MAAVCKQKSLEQKKSLYHDDTGTSSNHLSATPEEEAEIKKAVKKSFQEGDLNCDGAITRDEFASLFEEVHAFSEEELDKLFNAVDENGDGCVNLEEFMDWVLSDDGLPKPNLTIVFRHIFSHECPGEISDHYQVSKETLGQGGFGSVCKATCSETKQVRAIKTIPRAVIKNPQRFENEVGIQQRLDHPNVVRLYEVYQDSTNNYLVMELCTGGELFDAIIEQVNRHEEEGQEHHAFTERDAATIFEQVCGSLCYMHSQNFVHRDIKPENFLLQHRNNWSTVKLIDFGLSRKYRIGKSPPMKSIVGTPDYMAPEVFRGSYTEKCDIWSCGTIGYILLCGYPPFEGNSTKELQAAITKQALQFESPDWDDITPQCKELITIMMRKDHSKRPHFSSILEDSWFSKNVKAHGKVVKNLGERLANYTQKSKFKKVVITCIAHQCSDDQVKDLRETFQAIDKNHDGTLTYQELSNGLQQCSIKLPGNINQIMKKLDTDGSGRIDYTEFLAATLQSCRRDLIRAAFNTFDNEGKGYIDAQNIQEVTGLCRQATIKELMTEADEDNDGKIDYEEFENFMRKKA